MAKRESAILSRQVRTLFTVGTVGVLTDAQLLGRFTACDAEAAELAFAALVERHGPMVLRVCRVILRDEHEARDAFQATFLVLVRKARILRVRDSLGPWLHQVALRVASCARSAAARRRRHERHAAELASARSPESGDPGDLSAVLHEEIDRLPERLRAPVVLCGLEGLTREQAARRLGWPLGTVQSRLARGRERLRDRLTRRGVAPAVVLSGAPFSGEVVVVPLPGEFVNPLIRAATRFAAGTAAPVEVVSAAVLALTEGVLRIMILTRLKMAGTAFLLIGLAATGAGVWASQKSDPQDQTSGRTGPVHPAGREASPVAPIVARVNGTPITRAELAERCLAQYGAKELDVLINRLVLEQARQRRGIRVTDDEIDAEVFQISLGVGMTSEDWLRTLNKERGIPEERYRREIIYPALLLRKMGGDPATAFPELKKKAAIEVYLAPPGSRIGEDPRARSRRDEGDLPTSIRTQEDRLRDVERKLDEVLKSIDDAKGSRPRTRP